MNQNQRPAMAVLSPHTIISRFRCGVAYRFCKCDDLVTDELGIGEVAYNGPAGTVFIEVDDAKSSRAVEVLTEIDRTMNSWDQRETEEAKKNEEPLLGKTRRPLLRFIVFQGSAQTSGDEFDSLASRR